MIQLSEKPAMMRCVACPFVISLCAGCSLVLGPQIQGSGVSSTQQREVDEFHAVAISCGGDAVIEVGAPASLTLTVDDNLQEVITTEVRGGSLEIGANERFKAKIGPRCEIATPVLDKLRITGSSSVDVTNLDEQSFELSITGSGDVRIEGAATNVQISISGSGDADLSRLIARSGEVHITGSGNVTVHVEESLNATITGSGDIEYLGDPEVTRRVTGSGSISPRHPQN